METPLIINVSLTSQDIKDIYFSEVYRDYPKRKPNMLSNIAFCIITFLDIFSILFLLSYIFIKLFLDMQ